MTKTFQKCRLCSKLGDFCSIFDDDGTMKLSDMVMAFADVQIHEGDGLSDRVCTTCVENLSTAYLFKLQCERTNTLLHKYPEQLEKPIDTNFDDFYNQEFHIHSDNGLVEGRNDQNNVKDYTFDAHLKTIDEISDETDSDVDSVKCVYCNQSYNHYGAHTCNVTCTIERNELQQSGVGSEIGSGSDETLVATDNSPPVTPVKSTHSNNEPTHVNVQCVLCEQKYDNYDDYVIHINRCTTNVKLQHYVCPVCHEINTDKLVYLEHLKDAHFKVVRSIYDSGEDCVDSVPILVKTRKPKVVRRQIGWSIEDIYQEIECKRVEDKETPKSSPFKSFLSKIGSEHSCFRTSSKHSTPKKVTFRNWIETSKAKTSNYFPFRKYIDNYRLKRKSNNYAPINSKSVTSTIRTTFPEATSDSDYNSPSGTSEDSWKMKQNLICACDKKVFMLSELIHDRDRIVAMINELGGVVAENTKMEMMATHFISILPNDTFTGMMVCSLATGKWLLHVSFIYDSFRCKKFLREDMYEWLKHPKIVELDATNVEVAKAAVHWHLELQSVGAKYPFEGKQIVLIMRKKYRQYYQMIFKSLKAKTLTYDPRTPGSCCSADFCFVDMKIIERVKLRFFFHHNVPVFPYQFILVYLLKKGRVEDQQKYMLQDTAKFLPEEKVCFLNNTF
ncbi:PREDICTED: uncharacterized protein LOC106107996 isoform X2 [Papilio polytes]|uniref:uncharacterized protein LOC106107996 isoform X2 n=1 Tax=Papilio polytes TaxID=76194 RepID=UPI000676266B|nr:PREDICTED: uncharacterized protein LOC106107996 isoform X2 [Papilio polytes]